MNFDSQVEGGDLDEVWPVAGFGSCPKGGEGLDLKPLNHSHPPGSSLLPGPQGSQVAFPPVPSGPSSLLDPEGLSLLRSVPGDPSLPFRIFLPRIPEFFASPRPLHSSHQSRRYYFLSEEADEGEELHRQRCLDAERQVGPRWGFSGAPRVGLPAQPPPAPAYLYTLPMTGSPVRGEAEPGSGEFTSKGAGWRQARG